MKFVVRKYTDDIFLYVRYIVYKYMFTVHRYMVSTPSYRSLRGFNYLATSINRDYHSRDGISQ